MKSVKRVLKRSFQPRYNLRSRKTANTSTITSTPKVPKVDTSVQANLSEEENCELLHELPFRPRIGQVPPRQANIQNSNKSFTEQSRSIPTAHTSPDTANRTNRETIDISIDQNETEASIFQANSANKQLPRSPCKATESSSLEDFSPIDSRRLLSGPRIALEVEQISETSDKEPHSPKQGHASADVLNSPLINSPALIHNQVTDRINYIKPKQTKKLFRSKSNSSYEFETTETDSEREDSEDSEDDTEIFNRKIRKESEKQTIENHKQKPELASMEAATLRELQDQMDNLQTQMRLQHRVQQQTATALEQVPLPEIVNARRPPPFHGYDSEDVNRWLDKIENYLKLRRIDLATPTAQAELVSSLAGPAEDYYYSLPLDQKSTYVELRDSLKERFANDNQSWIIWQAVSTRKQGEKEPLDTYLTDLTNKFRRLSISDTEKMRYFVQGLRPEIRETVLLRQPKSFREAEEIARLTCAVKRTVISPVIDVPRRLSHSTGNASNHVLLAKIEELSKKLETHKQPTKTDATLPSETSAQVYSPTNVAYLDEQPECRRALHHLQEKIEQLSREWDAKMRLLPEAQPYGNYNDDHMTRIAAFSEPRRETPVLNWKIRRIEDKFQELYRRVDARINALTRKSVSNRNEPPRHRTREEQRSQRTRRGRPICFKCRRVGHIQYNCYNYNRSGDLYQNQEENTNSLEADQETNTPRPNKEVTNDQQPRICPNHERSYNRKRRELRQTVQQSNILLLRKSDANVKSSDLTTEGKIADQSVQLLVDTGACVSAIDKQFFTKIYGQFPPQLRDGSLTSVQTVSGDTVPVLGKITVSLQLNGREYPCEFHVMQNLAYDAILGRDFLQENGALIDLVDNTLSFKGATHPGKQSTNTTTVSVMGTFLPQPQNLKEKKTETSQAEPAPSPKLAQQRQKSEGLLFQQPLLVLMFIIVYLLTASCTPHMKDSAKPVIQKMPKFFVQGTPDFNIEDSQVIDTAVRQSNCKEKDKSVPNEREAERINIPKSKDAAETLKSDYSSQITVGQKFIQQEDEKKDFLDAINAHLRDKVPRY